ncbi:MAG: DUF4132 domain-containing protein [Armatimonadetes bacterium]|nr:DUF4132 domain-containing protein [Armatimonadota bacterium]
MPGIVETLQQLASMSPYAEILGYVRSGKPEHLELVPSGKEPSWWQLGPALDDEPELSQEVERILKVLVARGWYAPVGSWLLHFTERGADRFPAAVEHLEQLGMPRLEIVSAVAKSCRLCREGSPTPAGDFLLQTDGGEAIAALRAWNSSAPGGEGGSFELFLNHSSTRLAELLAEMLRTKQGHLLGVGHWVEAARGLRPTGVELAKKALKHVKHRGHRLQLLAELATADPDAFFAEAESTARQQLLEREKGKWTLWHDSKEAGLWLVRNCGSRAFDDLTRYFGGPPDDDPWRQSCQSEYKIEVLDEAVGELDSGAMPLVRACFETEQPEVQLRALRYWMALASPENSSRLAEVARQALRSKDSQFLAAAVRLLAEWSVESLEPQLWPLLAHKSRPVREAGAAALARLGDSRLDRAADLWKARRADARLAAVSWLRALGTPGAAEELRSRLECEEDENVRDALLLAQEELCGAEAPEPAELESRVRRILPRLSQSPASWLDPAALPRPRLKSGEELGLDWLRYLLYRQSRVKEMRPDIEAQPMYQLVDRQTSGELALSVLQGFLDSQSIDDRWAMALAALLGDDRLVGLLTRQIDAWAGSGRGKVAEHAVWALGLLGTDLALQAVDALAIRYSSKQKNIGKAAAEAFAEAARTRGVSVEELGELVVPWLGFEPNRPRLLTPKAEVAIGADLKLELREPSTGRKLSKPPAEAKAAFKELCAGLKEAVKSQTVRIEALMVRQHRWTLARWRKLYLVHPLLRPFAQRLVWGVYSGQLAGTFRALADGSLTDAHDSEPVLPPDGRIGVVHPLEIAPELRQKWLEHFSDYEVVAPFLQLGRPVVLASSEEGETRFGSTVSGTELNAMTFRGRAERLGWSRGSVCDGGCVNFYVKRFPGAGVDAFLETDGMYVGIDVDSSIRLGKSFFVHHDSVRLGSYVYDEPTEESDPRLIRFGSVPPIAFSESVGDLLKIAGN